MPFMTPTKPSTNGSYNASSGGKLFVPPSSPTISNGNAQYTPGYGIYHGIPRGGSW